MLALAWPRRSRRRRTRRSRRRRARGGGTPRTVAGWNETHFTWQANDRSAHRETSAAECARSVGVGRGQACGNICRQRRARASVCREATATRAPRWEPPRQSESESLPLLFLLFLLFLAFFSFLCFLCSAGGARRAWVCEPCARAACARVGACAGVGARLTLLLLLLLLLLPLPLLYPARRRAARPRLYPRGRHAVVAVAVALAVRRVGHCVRIDRLLDHPQVLPAYPPSLEPARSLPAAPFVGRAAFCSLLHPSKSQQALHVLVRVVSIAGRCRGRALGGVRVVPVRARHAGLSRLGCSGQAGSWAGSHPMAFCQMPCVLRDADVCMRLFAGIRTRPAVAGMVQERGRFVVGSQARSGSRKALCWSWGQF